MVEAMLKEKKVAKKEEPVIKSYSGADAKQHLSPGKIFKIIPKISYENFVTSIPLSSIYGGAAIHYDYLKKIITEDYYMRCVDYGASSGGLFYLTVDAFSNDFESCFNATVPLVDVVIFDSSEEKVIEEKMNSLYLNRMSEVEGKKYTHYLKRPILQFSNKPFLSTNYNYAELGKFREDGIFVQGTKHNNVACCAFTKTNQDILVYIPIEWLNYYGYNKNDLIRYLKFLQGCDINIKYTLLENGSYSEFTKTVPSTKKLYGNKIISKNEYVKLVIHGTSSNMITYLHFLLVRYLYNASYWNIPLICLQMRAILPDEVSNFKILLMAHLFEDYNGYYSLAQNLRSTKSFVDIEQKNKDLLYSLSTGTVSMNASCKLKVIELDVIDKFRNLVKTKEFKKAYNLISNDKI